MRGIALNYEWPGHADPFNVPGLDLPVIDIKGLAKGYGAPARLAETGAEVTSAVLTRQSHSLL